MLVAGHRTAADAPCGAAFPECGAAEEEYFSDGLHEELIVTLSQLRSLHVAARTSAFAFKGPQRDVREIARRLRVIFLARW